MPQPEPIVSMFSQTDLALAIGTAMFRPAPAAPLSVGDLGRLPAPMREGLLAAADAAMGYIAGRLTLSGFEAEIVRVPESGPLQ